MVAMVSEGLQSLSSAGATLAVQQVMLGGHSEDESGESGGEDGEEEEEEDDEEAGGLAGLGLEHSHSLQ